MKKQFLKSTILSLICLAVFAPSTFAGHNETRNSKCHWWSAKYKAEVHISYLSTFNIDRETGCDAAAADMTVSGFSYRVAESHSHSNSGSVGGWSDMHYSACWGGMKSDLSNAIASPEPPEDDITYTDMQNVSVTPNLDDASRVTFSDINLHFSDVASPLTNTYTLAIWVPSNDSDTIATSYNTISSSNISIAGGTLTISGDLFTASDFTVVRDGASITVDYTGSATKSFTLPAGVSIDDVSITTSGDIVGDGSGTAKKALAENTANGNNMKVYPVPAKNNISADISLVKDADLKLTVYNMLGKTVIDPQAVSVKGGVTQTVGINTGTLTPGTYYILATDKDKTIKILKQFVKQ
jgi:hypothetical protein